MPPKGKSLAEKAAAEIEARQAREAAQAHLKKAGQVVGNPFAKHVSRRPTTRDNTLSQVRSRQQASARAAVAKADAIAAALPGGRLRAAPQRVPVPDLPQGWSAAHIPPHGPTYFFDSSGVAQWTHPLHAPASILRSGEPVWRPVLQEATGAVYWWHVGDGRVQWSLPADVDIPGLATTQAMMAVPFNPPAPPLPPQSSGAAAPPTATMSATTPVGFVLPPPPGKVRGPPMPAAPSSVPATNSAAPGTHPTTTQERPHVGGISLKVVSRWGPSGVSGGAPALESAPKRSRGDDAK